MTIYRVITDQPIALCIGFVPSAQLLIELQAEIEELEPMTEQDALRMAEEEDLNVWRDAQEMRDEVAQYLADGEPGSR